MQHQKSVLTEQFVRDFIKRWTEAWNAHDVDRAVSMCTEDTVWQDPSAPEGVLQGREAVREFLQVFFRAVPDAHWEWLCQPYLTLDDTQVAGRWRMTATMMGPFDPPGYSPTNTPVVLEGIDFYDEFRDGLLSRYTVLFDMLGFGRQIGAVPKPGTFGERMGVLMQRMAARRMRKRARRQ
jgi:steroid delta-isomerase-like uncharacterized protein